MTREEFIMELRNNYTSPLWEEGFNLLRELHKKCNCECEIIGATEALPVTLLSSESPESDYFIDYQVIDYQVLIRYKAKNHDDVTDAIVACDSKLTKDLRFVVENENMASSILHKILIDEETADGMREVYALYWIQEFIYGAAEDNSCASVKRIVTMSNDKKYYQRLRMEYFLMKKEFHFSSTEKDYYDNHINSNEAVVESFEDKADALVALEDYETELTRLNSTDDIHHVVTVYYVAEYYYDSDGDIYDEYTNVIGVSKMPFKMEMDILMYEDVFKVKLPHFPVYHNALLSNGECLLDASFTFQ